MLSLLTLNMWNNDGPWPERLELIRGWIQLLAPDVVALQEVLRGPAVDQLADICGEFPHHAYAGMAPFWNDSRLTIGVALASRLPLEGIDTVPLPAGGSLPNGADQDPRVALVAEVIGPGWRLPVITSHFSFRPVGAGTRLRQAKAVSRIVAERRSEQSPVLFCGDLNDAPDSDSVRFLKGRLAADDAKCHLVDAWEVAGDGSAGHTFGRANSFLTHLPQADARIDYVLVSLPTANGLGQILRCERVCDIGRKNVYPSDHFGLYVELQTPMQATG